MFYVFNILLWYLIVFSNQITSIIKLITYTLNDIISILTIQKKEEVPMNYDCTKPLGNHLANYLDTDLDKISNELSSHGIVYESQFNKLWSMVCKLNTNDLLNLFSKKTQCHIWYAYDSKTCNFVFYDMDKYNAKEAVKLSINYQTLHEKDYTQYD